MIAKLYLVRGLPGSGKSTYVMKNKQEGNIHLEADMYFMVGNEYRFDPTKLRFAHQWCQNVTKASLEEGRSVWVSNTFTTYKEMKPYFEIAKELDIPVYVIRMETQYGSIHNVPDHAIQRMKERFVDVSGETIICA